MKLGHLIQLRPSARVSTDDLSDDALAAACATGDRAAQSLLFERHVDSIYRFLAHLRGADADAVDDLVQATFLAAFASADRFRGPRLQSWLFGIAAESAAESAAAAGTAANVAAAARPRSRTSRGPARSARSICARRSASASERATEVDAAVAVTTTARTATARPTRRARRSPPAHRPRARPAPARRRRPATTIHRAGATAGRSSRRAPKPRCSSDCR